MVRDIALFTTRVADLTATPSTTARPHDHGVIAHLRCFYHTGVAVDHSVIAHLCSAVDHGAIEHAGIAADTRLPTTRGRTRAIEHPAGFHHPAFGPIQAVRATRFTIDPTAAKGVLRIRPRTRLELDDGPSTTKGGGSVVVYLVPLSLSCLGFLHGTSACR